MYPSLAQPIVHLINRLPPASRGGIEGRGPVGRRPGTTPHDHSRDGRHGRPAPGPDDPGPVRAGRDVRRSAGRRQRVAVRAAPAFPDAFWLLRRIDRALRRDPQAAGATPRVALAVASDPLGSELRDNAPSIARYLGLAEFRVVDRAEEARPHRQITGRTRTGSPWWVSVPGLTAPLRPPKHRSARAPSSRIPERTTSEPGPGAIDFADDAVVAHGEAVRALGEELDSLLAAPLLGPSKVEIAWEAGLKSVQQFTDAPFDQLVAIPGFGRSVASTLWTKLGKEVPRPPAIVRTRPRPAKSVSTPTTTLVAPTNGGATIVSTSAPPVEVRLAPIPTTPVDPRPIVPG